VAGSAFAQDLTWSVPGDGGWNAVELNWTLPGGAASAFTDGSTVTFGGVGVPPVTVTIDGGDVATPSIAFDATGYTISC